MFGLRAFFCVTSCLGRTFCWCKVHMEERCQPKVPFGVRVGPEFLGGAQAGAALLGGWGVVGAAFSERDTGLAPAFRNVKGAAAIEAFPSTREARGSATWAIVPDPCPQTGVLGPVTSMLVGKTQTPGYSLGPAVPSIEVSPFLGGSGPGGWRSRLQSWALHLLVVLTGRSVNPSEQPPVTHMHGVPLADG